MSRRAGHVCVGSSAQGGSHVRVTEAAALTVRTSEKDGQTDGQSTVQHVYCVRQDLKVLVRVGAPARIRTWAHGLGSRGCRRQKTRSGTRFVTIRGRPFPQPSHIGSDTVRQGRVRDGRRSSWDDQFRRSRCTACRIGARRTKPSFLGSCGTRSTGGSAASRFGPEPRPSVTALS